MISVAAYLEYEKVADLKCEYLQGRRLPLVGGGPVHDRLCMRLAALLHAHLAGTECRLFRPPVKLYLRTPGDERFYYPDLQVACAGRFEHPEYLDAPRLILEVLAPATARRDREEKAPAYLGIPGLRELVLVACDAPRLEVWHRDGGWSAHQVGATQTLRLTSIGLPLAVDSLYAGLTLEGDRGGDRGAAAGDRGHA